MSKKRAFEELVLTNVFEMSGNELKEHITELRDTKRNFLRNVAPSVNQLNQQLELAQHELSSRNTARLAKISIALSTLAVVAAAVSIAI